MAESYQHAGKIDIPYIAQRNVFTRFEKFASVPTNGIRLAAEAN